MKSLALFIVFIITTSTNTYAQLEKKPLSPSEIAFVTQVFKDIAESDQLYRGLLAHDTTDPLVLAKIDSVFNNVGIAEGFAYEKSLNLSIDPVVEDSLWNLQHIIDFQNHMILRGLFLSYGWIPEEVVEEKNYVQILLLMHPPKDWDINKYLAEYSAILIDEVRVGRMPAKTYASFYDNIKGKILREPQLYGTNQQLNTKTNEIMPPGIKDLAASNAAREAIGMPLLKDGEYRIIED